MSTIENEILAFADGVEAKTEAVRARRTVQAQAAELKILQEQLTALHDKLRLYEHVENLVHEPPDWTQLSSVKKGDLHRATLCLLLSDTHFDEVVVPDEVEGVNAYNREIAVLRLKRMLERAIIIGRKHLAGLTYEGCMLFLGGDMLAGNIHEELRETNEAPLYNSFDYWVDPLVAFVQGLAQEFGKLHVVGVVGNHGRRTDKPRMKRRTHDDLDWLLYRVVARLCPEATWQLPSSADTDVKIFNTVFRLTHGDQVRGGNGIAGNMSPLMIFNYRKAKRQMAIGKPYDWLVMGHWHEYCVAKQMIMNGSLVGYNEYAYLKNLTYERPQQALWITTPEHGVTLQAPLFVADRKAEKW